MGRLTLELMDRPFRAAKTAAWRSRLVSLTRRLTKAHGTPCLGNFRDPVKEIFYIALSARTADVQYRRTHRALFTKFPTIAALAGARLRDIMPCVLDGGLANKRVRQMRGIARKLLHELGPKPAATLKRMSASEAFRFLISLPGLGPKSAFCVMMYSLGFDVFPVDVHVQRIMTRLGAIPRGLKHYRAQAITPGLIPSGFSRELHIALVVHGRTICLPLNPKCRECPIKSNCRTGQQRLGREGRADVD